MSIFAIVKLSWLIVSIYAVVAKLVMPDQLCCELVATFCLIHLSTGVPADARYLLGVSYPSSVAEPL